MIIILYLYNHNVKKYFEGKKKESNNHDRDHRHQLPNNITTTLPPTRRRQALGHHNIITSVLPPPTASLLLMLPPPPLLLHTPLIYMTFVLFIFNPIFKMLSFRIFFSTHNILCFSWKNVGFVIKRWTTYVWISRLIIY